MWGVEQPMDIVQRQQEQKRLLSASIWPIWSQFQARLEQTLQSYEDSRRSLGWSARLDSVHDRCVTITQSRGIASDGFHNQGLLITVSVREKEPAAITAAIEEYTERGGRHATLRTKKWEYPIIVDVDRGDCHLLRDAVPITPWEAADHLIAETILKT